MTPEEAVEYVAAMRWPAGWPTIRAVYNPREFVPYDEDDPDAGGRHIQTLYLFAEQSCDFVFGHRPMRPELHSVWLTCPTDEAWLTPEALDVQTWIAMQSLIDWTVRHHTEPRILAQIAEQHEEARNILAEHRASSEVPKQEGPSCPPTPGPKEPDE